MKKTPLLFIAILIMSGSISMTSCGKNGPASPGQPTDTPQTVQNTATLTPAVQSHTVTPSVTGTEQQVIDTFTYTPSETGTAGETMTETDVIVLSETETPSFTATASGTNADTATQTPLDTDTSTPADTATVTDTWTITETDSPTPTVTETATLSWTATGSATETVTSTPTETPSITETVTLSWTATDSATETVTPTPTETPSITETVTMTATQTITDTVTETNTDTPTFTATKTATDTETFTATGTYTVTTTITQTFTETGTDTATPTVTFTPTIGWSYTLGGTGSGQASYVCMEGNYIGYVEGLAPNHLLTIKTLAGGDLSPALIRAGEMGKRWMAVDGNGVLYVAFLNTAAASPTYGYGFVYKYDGLWSQVGGYVAGNTDLSGAQIQIYVDKTTNIPYVAFLNLNKITVRYFNAAGPSWDLVGAASFTPNVYKQSNVGSFSIDGYNIAATPYIYVAYSDWQSNSMCAVKYSTGGAWSTFGYISTTKAQNIDIDAFAGDDSAYVTFWDSSVSRSKVVKITGRVASTDFGYGTTASSSGNSVFVNGPDDVYLGFSNASSKGEVRRYSGGLWSNVGTAGFTAGNASSPNIRIIGGVPYFAFQDASLSFKASIMKYQ